MLRKMAAQDVLINFAGNTQGLQPVEDVLESIIATSGRVGEEWKKASSTISAESKKAQTSGDSLAKSIDKMATAAKSMDKAVVGGAYKDYLKHIQSQLGLTNKELIAYIQNARKAAQQAIIESGSEEEIKEISLGIDLMNEQLKELGVWEDQAGEKTKSLRARLREAKEELVQMAEAGLQGTPAFRELQQKAGELDDQMRDLNATVQGLGSDTKNIDGLISLASGLTGGFAMVQGAIALTGTENEDLQKALLKVNAAMSIMQGLQQVQNVLQKESAGMLLLSNIQTKGLALGQQFLAKTTMSTVGATYALRAALIASGIGALVVVIGAIASAMDSMGDETESAAKAQEKLADATEKFNRAAEIQVDFLAKLQELNRKRAEAAGKTEEEIAAMELKQIQERIDKRNKLLDEADKGDKVRAEELRKQNDEDIHAMQLLEQQIIIDANKKKKEEDEKAAEQRKKQAEKTAQALFEIEQRRLERERDLSANFSGDKDMGSSFRLSFLQREQAATLALIALHRKKELDEEDLTGAQIKNINDKYKQQELDAIATFNNRRSQIMAEGRQQVIDEAKKFTDEIEKAKKDTYESEIKAAEDAYQAAVLVDTQITNAKLANLDASFKAQMDKFKGSEAEKNKLIKEFEEQRAQILKDASKEELNDQITKINKMIEARRKMDMDTTDLEKQRADIQKQMGDQELKDFQDKEEKKTEKLRKEQEKRQAITQAGFQIVQEIANALFEVDSANRQQKLDEELKRLDEAKSRELDNKNLTEQQKADIEAKYQARTKQLKRQAAIADKQAAINQAWINGALAFTKALASSAPPLNFINAAAVAISTGIQVAKIKSTPIPQFAKGKVRIQGPGTDTSDSIPALISKDESVINAKSTRKWEDALLAINNDTFEAYLAKKFTFPEIPEFISTPTAPIDYDKLATAVADKMRGVIPSPKSVHVDVGPDGIRTIVQDGNSTTTFKTNRYSFT